MSSVMSHEHQVMNISVTPAATQRLLTCLAAKSDHQAVRLSVKKTGCSGLSYVMDFVTVPDQTDVVFPLNEAAVLCIEKRSYPYLKGLTIDYVKQGLNHKFVYTNPNQTGQCGCGESFTVNET